MSQLWKEGLNNRSLTWGINPHSVLEWCASRSLCTLLVRFGQYQHFDQSSCGTAQYTGTRWCHPVVYDYSRNLWEFHNFRWTKPDFCKSRNIPKVQFRLFNLPKSGYNVIVGHDVLKHGFILDHARNIVTWDSLTISMAVVTQKQSSITTSFTCNHSTTEIYSNNSTTILHAKYEKFPPQEVVNKCMHLAMNNKVALLQLLSKFPRLFSGSLGRYVHKNFSIQLKDPATPPILCTPYAVPLVHQAVFQQELEHLISKEVLRRIDRSEWAFPTFLIPKKGWKSPLDQWLQASEQITWPPTIFPPKHTWYYT